MAQNIGTLITAAIRPNDSNDNIATAFSSEVKGGVHTKIDVSGRNSIIEERREWGMLCYVESDNITYQLISGTVDNDINNNSNWVEFNVDENSKNNWFESVLSVITTPPTIPQTGDRYLGGKEQTDSLTGIWNIKSPGIIFEWNSIEWIETEPKNGDVVKVNDENNVTYKYRGNYPSGDWIKENINQIVEIDLTTTDNIAYTGDTLIDYNEYSESVIILATFDANNNNTDTQTPTVNINSLGSKSIKKPTKDGLVNLTPNDIISGIIYTLVYNGQNFELVKHFNFESLDLKNTITSNDYIIIPENHQYWIYGDLNIEGTLVNFGEVVISNGNLNLVNSGVFENDNGTLTLVSLSESIGLLLNDTDTISVTEETISTGLSYSFNVNDKSIDVVKLDNGSFPDAVNGYVLSNENGIFKWIPNSTGSQTNIIYQTENPLITSGDNQDTGISISNTVSDISSIHVYINGHIQILGDGTFDKNCYFSNDNGITASELKDIAQNSVLFFNGVISGYDLETDDTVLIIYEE